MIGSKLLRTLLGRSSCPPMPTTSLSNTWMLHAHQRKRREHRSSFLTFLNVFLTSLTLFQASNLSATNSELSTDNSSSEKEEFIDKVD